MKYVVILLAASALSAGAAINCRSTPEQIESRHKRLNELHALWAEMTNLFGDVEAAEGKVQPKAKDVKIKSSRKRLKSKIDTHEKELDDLTTAYCNSCLPAKPIDATNRFCNFCGELDACNLAQPKSE